ncbi:hypothetical protein DH2020_047439 [Rehmannia glutinosa]|uniref:Uncharacterized protein n=1 Tax=Rehmannia glutinosa TaxID=99300 RepID=A0ABR0UA24_REHGL
MDEVEHSRKQISKQNEVPGREQPSDSNAENKKTVPFFRLFAAADKTDYVLMFIGSIGACLQGAALPVFFVLFGRMINSLGSLSSDPHKFSSEVSKYALYLVYLGLVVWLSAWTGVACWTQTGERQTARLRLKYLESVLKKNIQFFDTEAGEQNIIFHISSDAILVQDAIGDKICHGLCYLSQFFVGFALGFSSVWQLTLVTLAIVPLIAVAGGAYTIIMSTLSKRGEDAYAEAGKLAEEVISQVRTVYSFVGEDKAIETYSNSLKNALKLAKKTGIAKGIGIGFTYGLLFCTWALLLWYASILVRHGDTNGGKAFTTIINVIYSGFALGQAAPNLAAIAKGRAAVASIINMIEDDPSPSRSSDEEIALPRVDGKIDFCEVCFAYPSRPTMIFENLNFSVCAGNILLDGHDIGKLQLKWLRSQIGLVSQEPALFATSIADNILFGKEGADMDKIIESAKASNAHHFIQGLPDGYHTQVGECGTQLSGGQKQRIAIARAILRDPKILLLDEATSALDAESESIVQQALDSFMCNFGWHGSSSFCPCDNTYFNRFYSRDDSRIKQEVRHVSFIFIGAALVTILIYLLQHYFYTLMGERLIARVRLQMFSAILSNEIGWFDKDENSTGSLSSKLATDATLVRSAIADRISTIIQNIALTVTAFVIAFVLSWRVAAVVVATFPLLIGANIAEQLFLKGFGGDYVSAYHQATELAREAIANIRTVAAFGAEERITAQFASKLHQPRKRALLRGHVLGFGYGISLFLAYGSYAIGLWYASVLIRDKKSEFGNIMKSFMVLIITALAVAETLALAPNLVKGSQVLESVFNILHRKTSIDPNNPSATMVTDIRGDIEFRNVSFKYPTRPDITVFRRFELKNTERKDANAHEFISRMPDGYHTQVGEKGVQLSGGQKQRVAIARAILKDPSILLLDEATSALDIASEMQVQEALNKLMDRRTTILVAHRLSTVQDADVITVLQNGKAAESGSHEQLLSKPGSIYFQLVHLQCDEKV